MATFQILKTGSAVNWTGKKVLGLHTGSIDIAEGRLNMEGDQIIGGEVLIDMASIRITDIEDPAVNKQFLDHLWHADFFDVAAYPLARFTLKKASRLQDMQYRLEGELSIKNITHPIHYTSTIEVFTDTLHAMGEMKIDRTLYDIRYGSGKFIANLGDKLIYDEFVLQFKILGQRI